MNEIIILIKNSTILQRKSIRWITGIFFVVWFLLSIIIIVFSIIPAELLPTFLQFNFENIKITLPLLTSILVVSSVLFLLFLTSDGEKEIKRIEVELQFKEMAQKIYEVLDTNLSYFTKLDFTRVGGAIKKEWKIFLRYEKNSQKAEIGLSNRGNLFVWFNSKETKENFISKNTGWLDTTSDDGKTTNGLYLEKDENVLSQNPKEILEIFKEYADIIKNTF